ncbi:uncharacterized protein BX663DRAFT_482130 [Cokeromyces recurvatus]|uniref:uncharacterized protein n=1 Tax=Cokeromyces recurvatus TaxID=90255 RepID=UPI00221EC74C|nr:uncharacterized protein BX663DRAFT_482130 [Cokeromyces recurvatus]KAI7907866.1 hypothetical protein BX663DRAFT_482130 [Cokeromyces recurvatus]
MNYIDIKAPGEKIDIQNELFCHLPDGNVSSSHLSSLNTTQRKRRVSTAHVSHSPPINTNNPDARFAFDELVSVCSRFLGSEVINETVKQFAENIVTLIGSPMTLDSTEVKRRLEQLLPTSHEFRYHRGMSLSDRDCTILCSLADRVVYCPNNTGNLNIVDDDDDNLVTENEPVERDINTRMSNNVHYIRSPVKNTGANWIKQQVVPLPRQLPNFIEPNKELGEGEQLEYDYDITPYDSDNEPPIQMVLERR